MGAGLPKIKKRPIQLLGWRSEILEAVVFMNHCDTGLQQIYADLAILQTWNEELSSFGLRSKTKC